MREHVRGNERYFRTEAGNLILDWGSNGADYNALDFSYVAKGKSGNLHKIYGQVRRNPDGETYDTYDIKAGRRRNLTTKSSTINAAIRAHITSVTGVEVSNIGTSEKMPQIPNSIRDAISSVLLKAISEWDFCFRGESAKWTAEQKKAAMEAFIRKTWNSAKFYCDTIASKKAVVPVGLLNVEVGEYGALYRLWRAACDVLTWS